MFFRAPSLEVAQAYLATLFAGDAIFSTTVTPLVAAMLVLGALTQIVPDRWFERLEVYYDRASLPVKVALPFVVIFLVCGRGAGRRSAIHLFPVLGAAR